MNNSKSVEKLVQGKQLSMRDDVLTPPHKMEAERLRMERPALSLEEGRSEEDNQRANLGGQILTPQRKMNMAWEEIQSKK